MAMDKSRQKVTNGDEWLRFFRAVPAPPPRLYQRSKLMKLNVGTTDRILRAAAGIGLIAFALVGPDVAYKWAGWIGVPLLLTAAFKFCPAYLPFGISTRGKEEDAAPGADA